MIQELQPDVFCVRIPLPGSPLRHMNSYVIRTKERNLIIDTGFNHAQCLEAMRKARQTLGLDVDRTDLFITHFHIDHFGLVPQLVSPQIHVYFNRIETRLIEAWEGLEVGLAYLTRHGFPKSLVPNVLEEHPVKGYFPVQWPRDALLVDGGDRIDLGPFQLECIHTPGHSPGHMCLYEARHRILFCGDHLLADISPNITCWSDEDNRLKEYLDSLVKTQALEVRMAYPGHHAFIDNHRATTQKIIDHHERRLSEIMEILSDAPQTAYSVASKMHWDLKSLSWDHFPNVQKCFATSEALAHLRYLEVAGKIRSLSKEGQVYFG